MCLWGNGCIQAKFCHLAGCDKWHFSSILKHFVAFLHYSLTINSMSYSSVFPVPAPFPSLLTVSTNPQELYSHWINRHFSLPILYLFPVCELAFPVKATEEPKPVDQARTPEDRMVEPEQTARNTKASSGIDVWPNFFTPASTYSQVPTESHGAHTTDSCDTPNPSALWLR